MDAKARKYIDLFRSVKIACAATVDEGGHPQSRVINVMIATDDGMYIVTSRGKPFHRQLLNTGEVALSASCPGAQSLKFLGKVRKAGREWLDEVFVQNPGLGEVYPGDSRYILDCFLIYEGHGEWFDLNRYPILRESFAYGGDAEETAGFTIGPGCTECGLCAELCPQKCIVEGTPYFIRKNHCLQCGLCAESCPAGAIEWLHP